VESIVPGSRDVRKFCKCREDHDDGCNRTTKRPCGPCQSGRVASLWLVYGRGIVCGVEPKRDVDDPDTVEVDEQMSERPLLVIRLEECAILVDAVKTHETLCWWNIDETSLTKRDEHQLVHVINR
jgi:hypothetical protein